VPMSQVALVNGNRILTPWRHLNLDPSIG
jgi:hypothetical protein